MKNDPLKLFGFSFLLSLSCCCVALCFVVCRFSFAFVVSRCHFSASFFPFASQFFSCPFSFVLGFRPRLPVEPENKRPSDDRRSPARASRTNEPAERLGLSHDLTATTPAESDGFCEMLVKHERGHTCR